MNFTKKVLSSAAAIGMAAVCLGNAVLPAMANDGLMLGDLNNDGVVNASDAAKVLIAAASLGAGNESGLTEAQTICGDVNEDGILNASDAAQILIYAAYIGAGGTGSLNDFLHPSEKPASAGLWSIEPMETTPGETVAIAVKVKGATKGVNSYIMKLSIDPRLVVVDAMGGDAFKSATFVANKRDGYFAGTNYTTDQDMVAEDNSTVCFVTVKVPDDAAPGDRYILQFEDLCICDYAMNTYRADTQDGYVLIHEPKQQS
ncbi:MAG: hypothetical protein K5695_07525 [Oscillospiraceae bacterium]|nr:hypothetical protein [Oscillospiraceae bacterium]